jgi:hypothetical protein
VVGVYLSHKLAADGRDHAQCTTQGEVAASLLVAIALVPQASNPPPPGPVAATTQVRAHQLFDLIRTKPVNGANLCEADMVTQRHLDHFPDQPSV